MSYNDDPIKENNPFRMGLDNLTGDDNINSGIEYSDLHDCSNDLSDRGSRREEREHAKFAEAQRNKYQNTYYASYRKDGNKKVVLAKKPGNVIFGIFVAYIAFQIIATVIAMLVGTVGMLGTNGVREPEYNYDYDDTIYDYDDYSYNNEVESVIPDFVVEMDTIKENVHIEAGKSDNGNLMVRLENQSLENMYSTRVQIIFFDVENKPINVTDLDVYSLYKNDIKTLEVYNVPEYASYDFIISERYAADAPYANELYDY